MAIISGDSGSRQTKTLEEPTSYFPFQPLPEEIHLKIFSLLDYSSLQNAALLCKGANRLANRVVRELFVSDLRGFCSELSRLAEPVCEQLEKNEYSRMNLRNASDSLHIFLTNKLFQTMKPSRELVQLSLLPVANLVLCLFESYAEISPSYDYGAHYTFAKKKMEPVYRKTPDFFSIKDKKAMTGEENWLEHYLEFGEPFHHTFLPSSSTPDWMLSISNISKICAKHFNVDLIVQISNSVNSLYRDDLKECMIRELCKLGKLVEAGQVMSLIKNPKYYDRIRQSNLFGDGL